MVQPCRMVVVAVNDGQPQFFGVAGAFVFTDFVFFTGEYVGVEVVQDGCFAIGNKPFNDGRSAGGAAGVE